ncbi:IS200/IS605 family transposase [Candidatus Sumerlaeota bacterium]|nr:IS200/IS605 family transposase [Candidatus Sumerlaeota bacterium]
MSIHSYTRCWLHMIWATHNRAQSLHTADARAEISAWLHEYAREKNIYMKVSFVNPDHVHALIDLPSNLSMEETAKLLKGASSHWINQERIVPEPFHWQRGYGAFSVSPTRLDAVCKYVLNQERRHKKRAFDEEMRQFVEMYGLVWREEEEDR